MSGKKGSVPWNKGKSGYKMPRTKDKNHPMLGKKQSPETIAKRQATMAAKREARENGNPRAEDAAGYLRQAMRILDKNLTEGKIKRRDAAHLLAELALKTLEGEL